MASAADYTRKIKDDQCPVLYITYDGLSDPLGSSQILPYLLSIARHTGPLHILSFEKKARFHTSKDHIHRLLTDAGISWHPVFFSENKGWTGPLFKVFDFFRMYVLAFWLCLRYKIKMVHARSHLAALAGLFLKRWMGVQLLFDCRGLWVDERIDKGGWNLSNPWHRKQFNRFKKKERTLFSQADEIIVLTHKAVDEVLRLGAPSAASITVIPCCADYDHFRMYDKDTALKTRAELSIDRDAMVTGYLGSVGGMYMFREFLSLHHAMKEAGIKVTACIITPDIELATTHLHSHLSPEEQQSVRLFSADRTKVPYYLAAMDVLVSFIRPGYARVATSPTKNAEAMAAGIPLICNPGIGDVEDYVTNLKAGWIVDPADPDALRALVNELKSTVFAKSELLRENSRKMFGLEVAEHAYAEVYQRLKEKIRQ